MQHAEDAVFLGKGDLILLYTDGLIEARRDNAFFGEKRLLDELEKPLPLAEIPEHIFKAVTEFSGGRLADDMALLVFSPK